MEESDLSPVEVQQQRHRRFGHEGGGGSGAGEGGVEQLGRKKYICFMNKVGRLNIKLNLQSLVYNFKVLCNTALKSKFNLKLMRRF